MKCRTRSRWDKRSETAFKRRLQKAGFKRVRIEMHGHDQVTASFDAVDPFERRGAEKIGKAMGLIPQGGGTQLNAKNPRSDVSFRIRWRKRSEGSS